MNKLNEAAALLAAAGTVVLVYLLVTHNISVAVAIGGVAVLYGLRFITARLYYRHFYVQDWWRREGHTIRYQCLVEDRIRNTEIMEVLSECSKVLLSGDKYTMNRLKESLRQINEVENKSVRNVCVSCLSHRGHTPPHELLADAGVCAFCGSGNDIFDVDLLALYEGLGLDVSTIHSHLPRYRRLVGRGEVDRSWAYIGRRVGRLLKTTPA